ncbi:CBS domain-containing protein [Streptomyces sp. NPDC050549]|uniref:CBS domain-containing protein n=1 Tax=Streptomyces sp. NPDC050549 TaxID=3155406 RepID=UPI003442FF77
MTSEVVSTRCDAQFKEVARLLAEHRISGLPVVNDEEKVVGVISETDLLYHQVRQEPRYGHRRFHLPKLTRSARVTADKAHATTAEHLMTRPAVITAPDQYVTEAAQTMEQHDVERLPVVDAKDHLVGIVTRGNLLQVFLRPDDEIRRDVINQVTQGIDCPRYAVDVTVDDGVVTLKGHLDGRSDAALAARIAGRVDGVVVVTDQLTYRPDDSRPPGPTTGPAGHV